MLKSEDDLWDWPMNFGNTPTVNDLDKIMENQLTLNAKIDRIFAILCDVNEATEENRRRVKRHFS